MTNTANPNKNSRAEEIVHRDMPPMFRQAPAEVNPQKDSPKKTLGGGIPRLASKLNWDARARPIAEASLCLVWSHCTRIFSSAGPLFASDSRPESEADDARISGPY
jgi:hypothetical protein